MKTVSIYELKCDLSGLIREAAAGEPIVITRHHRVVAALTSAELGQVHVGSRFGSGTLEPLLCRATGGKYLEVLAEDRRTER
jgi:prevent-host-death family protein